MDEFNKLKASVLEQAEAKGQEYYQRAINEINKEIQARRDELQNNQENVRKERLNLIKRQHERVLQQVANQERQTSLLSKQDIIRELFTSAQETMAAWPLEEEISFIHKILDKHQGDKLIIRFGQVTKDKFTDQELEALKEKYPHLLIDQETLPLAAGFKLIKEKVDYNYIYADLIADSQKDISAEIASQVYLDE